MRIDLHCHSLASPDSVTPLEVIPTRCREKGIDVQAITDHDQIWAAQELQRLVREDPRLPDARLTVIVGEEIKSRDGEIIGLYLTERIEPGLSAEETIRQIKAQGGLVLVPHGFDPLKAIRLNSRARERLAESIDIIETYNAHISSPRWNRVAARWATEHNKPFSAGSDSHVPDTIGRAWVETPDRVIAGPEDLLEALREGTPQGTWSHPLVDLGRLIWHWLVQRWRRTWAWLPVGAGR